VPGLSWASTIPGIRWHGFIDHRGNLKEFRVKRKFLTFSRANLKGKKNGERMTVLEDDDGKVEAGEIGG